MVSAIRKFLLNRFLDRIHSETMSYFYSTARSDKELRAAYPEFSIGGKTPLCDIMNVTGSDKGNHWHNYTKVYHQLMAQRDVKHLFELGIGTTNTAITSTMGPDGTPMASHRGWKKYFDKATIYAADIDGDVAKDEEGIHAYQCDQTDAHSIKAIWDQPTIPDEFDVIIDDGLHEFEANISFFENSIHKLKKGGLYIIEDIQAMELAFWDGKIKNQYVNLYPNLVFRICSIPNLSNVFDNNLLIIYKP
ncbi:MAG: hypothetical protein ABF321_10070 [Bacteroidia bacterium]|nr:class I SAM-dependent methyltransferase [Bacteroidia bacterium]